MKNPKLEASLGYAYDPKEAKAVVRVYFGDEIIAELEPCRESKASHGDDSSYFAAEDRAIVEETVAPYLRKLFTP